MNPGNQNDGILYQAAAFAIFVVLVTLIVLATISSRSSDEMPTTADTTAATKSTVTTLSPDTAKKESTAAVSETTIPEVSDTEASTTITPVTTYTAAEPEDTVPPVTTQPTVTAKPHEPVSVPTGNTPDEIAEFLAQYPNTVLAATEDAGQEYIDKLIFLGDSTTYGLRANAVLPGGKETTQVWTPSNGFITLSQANSVLIKYPETGKELPIKDAAALKKPEYLVITLGVNGVSFMDEKYFKKEYGKLIESIQESSPETKIILQSIFPVAKNYESLKSINNGKIDAANKWIVQLAEEYGVKYVDTNSVLRDADGWLVSSYQNGDGLHLTKEGLNIELNNLRTHAWID